MRRIICFLCFLRNLFEVVAWGFEAERTFESLFFEDEDHLASPLLLAVKMKPIYISDDPFLASWSPEYLLHQQEVKLSLSLKVSF